MSSKEKKRQNKFNKMVALNNLLEKPASENSSPIEPVPDEELPPTKKLKLTDAQFQEVKKELDAKKAVLRNKPKLKLKAVGELATMERPFEQRQPLFLDDIHSLVMNLYFGSSTVPHNPWRWCHLEKIAKVAHTILVYVSGMSSYDFSNLESRLVNMNRIFPTRLEITLPSSNSLEKFLRLPLIDMEKRQLIQDHGSLDAALALAAKPLDDIRPVYPISDDDEAEAAAQDLLAGETFSRTKLLLSALQMVDEGYPVPVMGDLAYRYADYRMTKSRYKPATSKSPMFAMDCEMCQTTLGVHEITRVSIVNEKLESVYETFVKPDNKITNYMTAFSGITEEKLQNITKTLKSVQEDIRTLLPADAILVGQSLNVDLHCLKMMHPYVIDTSVIFNISGERKSKSKLKTLAREFLGEVIQNHAHGHDSIEDSAASMKLVQLKLEKSLEYGDMVLINRARFDQSHEPKKGVKKTVCLLGSKSCAYDFQTFFRTLSTHPSTVETLQVKSFWADDNQAALKSVAENCLQYSFTVANVDVTGAVATTVDTLDAGLADIFNGMATNGCLIAVLGSCEGQNPKRGVALCRIKE